MSTFKDFEVNGKREDTQILFYDNLSYNCVYGKNVKVINALEEFKEFVGSTNYKNNRYINKAILKIISEFENANRKLRTLPSGDIKTFTKEVDVCANSINFELFYDLLYKDLGLHLNNDPDSKKIYKEFKKVCKKIGIYSLSESKFRKEKDGLNYYFNFYDSYGENILESVIFDDSLEIMALPLYVLFPPKISAYYQEKSGKFPYTKDDIKCTVDNDTVEKEIKRGVIKKKCVVSKKINLNLIDLLMKDYKTLVQNAFYAYYYKQLTSDDVRYLVNNGHMSLSAFVDFGIDVGFKDVIDEFFEINF